MPRLRVLIIAPYPLYPALSGGKIRIDKLARRVIELGIEVTVLCPYKPSATDASSPLRVIQIPYPFLLHHFVTDRPLPYQYLISIHPGYRRWLGARLRQHDIVQFEHASFADLLPGVPPEVPVIYDAHNVELEYVTSECRTPLERNFVGRRMFALEAALVRRAQRVIACSRDDSARLQVLYGATAQQLRVVPNGVDTTVMSGDALLARQRFPGLDRFPVRALFAGSNVAHNRAAVDFLVRQVAPYTSAAIVIRGGCARHLGPVPSNVFLALDGTAIGAIAPACNVALHPVSQGGGTSLKLLDYLVHGLPVIATEFGIRGYPELRPFVTIRRPDEFAAALAAPPRFEPAVRTVLERYLWQRGAEDLAAIYRELAPANRE